MDIIIFRYSPRVVMLNNLKKNNTIVIAPEIQKEKYNKFLSQGYKLGNVLFKEDFILPEIIREIRKIQIHHTINSITTLTEEDIVWVALLNDFFTNKKSTYLSNTLFKDKYFMRSFLIDEVNQPYFRLISSRDEIKKFWKISKCKKAIIKPRYGAGSEKMHIILRSDKIDDIDEKFCTGEYLIEDFLNLKNMLTCDGFAIGKKIVRFYSHEYDELLLNSITNTKELVVRTNSLYNKNIDILKIALKESQKVLSNFAIKNELTPFHFEWFFDYTKKKFYFCEVGKRFGGAGIPFLIEYAFGIDILKEYWHLLTKKTLKEQNFKEIIKLEIPSCIACNYAPYTRDGVVKFLPDVKEFSWTKNIWIFVKVGEKTEKVNSIMKYILVSEFISNDEREYKKNLKKLRKLIPSIYGDNKND